MAALGLLCFGLLVLRPCYASPPPVITVQPTNQAVHLQDSVSFAVVAASSTTLSYQWLKNGTNISGATLSVYTLAAVQTNDANIYSVRVVNGGGTMVSSNATLTVLLSPWITNPPPSQTVSLGQTASFNVGVSSTLPLKFQWQLGANTLAGETNATLTIAKVQALQAGSYTVVVTNSAGSATSAIATLTVNLTVALGAQPQSQTILQGQTAIFTASAGGLGPLTFDWYRNGALVTSQIGGTSSSFTIDNAQTSDAGTYAVKVSNALNLLSPLASSNATLTVLVPPTITNQPQSQAVGLGQGASFSVAAGGTSPLSYQWNFNGTNISGATNATLTYTNLQTTNTGNYTVMVTNIAGAVTSAVAMLAVYVPPAITISNQMPALTKVQGQSVSFSVLASGTAQLTYLWSVNGTNLINTTISTLTISNVQTTDAGNYTVVVTNIAGSATGSVASLTVYVPPTITTQPQGQALFVGQTAAFAVGAAGTAPLRYRWLLNGTNISGATNLSLTITNIQAAKAGNYTVVVTNIAGSVTSTVANLIVYVPPTITNQPLSQALIIGQTAIFTVGASGTAPFNYQWTFNGTNLLSATNATLVLTNLDISEAGNYTVVVTNIAGSATSAVATLTVSVPPFIITQPLSQSVVNGQNISLSVLAGGSATLTYQWYFSGSKITGSAGRGSTLTISGAGSSDSGDYKVVVTNTSGSVTSTVATVKVFTAPTISSQLKNQAVTQGNNATLTVSVSGTAPLTYDWYFNGTNFAETSVGSLLITNVATSDAGSYRVVIANFAGSVTSRLAAFIVNIPAYITNQPQSQAAIAGQSVTFNVGAGGTAALSYQWYFKGGIISSNQTTPTFTLSSVGATNAGDYTVVVTNVAGIVTSVVATLTVYVPPTISHQPQGQALSVGQTATFSVTASGTATLAYQWFFQSNALAGATNDTLILTGIHAADAGDYTAVVTNSVGWTTSAAATLTVTNPIVTLASARSTGVTTNGFSLQFSVPAGATYVILSSTNFQDWIPLVTNVAPSGIVEFTDPAASSIQGFYRVMVQ